MQIALSTEPRVTPTKPEVTPPLAVRVAAQSAGSRDRIELLVGRAGARLTAESGAREILLIAIDSSTWPYASDPALTLLKPSGDKVCAIWVGKDPTPGTISRLQ